MTVNELIKKFKCLKEVGKGEYDVRVHIDIDGVHPSIADIVNDVGDCFDIDDRYWVVMIHGKGENYYGLG